MTHSKMIGRRQFIKGVAAGAVVLTAPYLLLPRKSAMAQIASSRAFIGAQGFGAGANGWRSPSAQIVFVTNLNDSGAGSFRQAVIGTTGPRYVIFQVAGYITIASSMSQEDSPGDSGNVYIAGQTAPGGGVTIRTNSTWMPEMLNLRRSQVCIRHLRFRQRRPTGGTLYWSCLLLQGLGSQSNVIVDHVSTTWASDGGLTIESGHNLVTIQNCLAGEGLNGAKEFLSKASTANRRSVHHNYLCHSAQRFPTIDGGGVEVINNLTYNWGECGGPGYCAEYFGIAGVAQLNSISNLWKWGPTSGDGLTCNPASPPTYEIRHYGSNTLNGSMYSNGDRVNIPSGLVNARILAVNGGLTVVGSPHSLSPTVPVTIQTADTLPSTLLPNVGCTKPARDSVDQAIVDSYAAFTGNSVITHENQTVGGNPFPGIAAGTPDHLQPSGMTQEFITRMGLANTVASALSTSISQSRGLGENYQNIEWNLMEKAGDIAPLNGGGGSTPPSPPTGLSVS